MTKQNEIIDNPKYRPMLDHGFIGLVDVMGNDAAIVQAARVSYGAGTKTVNEDRGLIRYLLRHLHTSPLEMCEIKFHVKAPIFVARQWVRHRMSNTNEESGRYSLMEDEFYIPENSAVQAQSLDNKQGRSGALSDQNAAGVQWLMEAANDHSHQIYKVLTGDRIGNDPTRPGSDVIYDPYSEGDGLLDDTYPETGIARELARTVMPLSSYTSWYWKIDLWNLLRFIHLRKDMHAQLEIRVYAEAIVDLVTPLFPYAMEAANDYLFAATHNSRMDMIFIKDAIVNPNGIAGIKSQYKTDKELASAYGMNLRELRELIEKLT